MIAKGSGRAFELMKSPPEQYHDDIARDRGEEFISIYGRKPDAASTAPAGSRL